MKANMSKDGNLRFTIAVKYRCGIPEVEAAINALVEKKELKINRTKVFKEIRSNIHSQGIYYKYEEYALKDNIPKVKQISKNLFPELYGWGI